jgi:hypothetical protein
MSETQQETEYNDASSNPAPLPVIDDNMYTDASGNKIPLCNQNTNGQEYHFNIETAAKVTGASFSIPISMSLIGSTSLMAIIFGSIALGIRYGGKDKKITGGVIALIIFFFLCLISMTASIITMKKNIKDIQETKGDRPCYSTTQNKVIDK